MVIRSLQILNMNREKFEHRERVTSYVAVKGKKMKLKAVVPARSSRSYKKESRTSLSLLPFSLSLFLSRYRQQINRYENFTHNKIITTHFGSNTLV